MAGRDRGEGELAYLSGDIGGTHTRLQLGRVAGGAPQPLLEQVYLSAGYPSLAAAAQAFLAQPRARELRKRLAAACFAVAGPVQEGWARFTNLPWQVEATALAADLGVARVEVLNDFVAAAYGVEALAPPDQAVLQPGVAAPHGAKVVLGAGTGLGVAALVWTGERYQAVASEAGHMDFASLGPRQAGLAEALADRFGRVSYERVLSGAGLEAIDRYLQSQAGAPPRQRTAREITALALAGEDPVADQALDLFVAVYGAFAGNVALAFLATGGVYLAGGIAPKILPRLTSAAFLEPFRAKGRFSALLAAMPVAVVLDEGVGLKGASRRAAALALRSRRINPPG
ncbi:glucokinase [Pelomicrobium sp. G1]|uniref:glucokinase n=1 Tax=unclassified Pelomicrobium TaxID=2815318 RepID=UPI003F7683A5